jgi:uncharacterized protein
VRPHFLAPMLGARPEQVVLRVAGSSRPLAHRLLGAFDSASRRRGLLGRGGLAEGEALVIAPCSAVHTFGMRFPIGIVFARRDGVVLKVREAVPPARIAASLTAFAVIEMAAGSASLSKLRPGDCLELHAPAHDR